MKSNPAQPRYRRRNRVVVFSLIATVVLLGIGLFGFFLQPVIEQNIHEGEQKSRASAFFDQQPEGVVNELDCHGLTQYLSADELAELETKFRSDSLNTAERYLLSMDADRSSVGASQLLSAFTNLTNVGNGDRSFDDFVSWVATRDATVGTQTCGIESAR